jgi:4-hydroxy-tetrahydrodipicolinate synthase
MPASPPLFHGVVPPVVTPLTLDHQVDFPSFAKVIEHLIAGGVHGLFVLGSTSEVVFHDQVERRKIIEFAVEKVNGRVPVLAGVIDPTTDRVIELARTAQSIGVNAVVATAPFYARTSAPETADHFRYLREAIGVPVIAYDIPVCVHFKLDRHTVVTLAREGTIAGLKDSSGDDGNFRFVLMDLADKPEISLMTGSEIVCDSALAMGAHGIVPGLANVDPAGYVRLYDLCRKGDWAAARKEQERLCRLFEIVWLALGRTSAGSAGVGAFKTAMRRLGVIATNQMERPQRALNESEAAAVDAILAKTGLLA